MWLALFLAAAVSTVCPYLEKESHDEHLQACHSHHHKRLDNTQVEDSSLCAPDRAEVAVLSCAEVLLVAGDGGELARQLEDRLLEGGGLLWRCALLRWQACALLVLDLETRQYGKAVCRFQSTHCDLEVHKLLGESAHLVIEAESVLSSVGS